MAKEFVKGVTVGEATAEENTQYSACSKYSGDKRRGNKAGNQSE